MCLRAAASIPLQAQPRNEPKAAYRFFDHESTTMDRLLEPHRGATVARLRREPVVLLVQDTTSLNYTGRPALQGIGPIGSWANGPKGLLLHNTMAFRPDGLALGLLEAHSQWFLGPQARDLIAYALLFILLAARVPWMTTRSAS